MEIVDLRKWSTISPLRATRILVPFGLKNIRGLVSPLFSLYAKKNRGGGERDVSRFVKFLSFSLDIWMRATHSRIPFLLLLLLLVLLLRIASVSVVVRGKRPLEEGKERDCATGF